MKPEEILRLGTLYQRDKKIEEAAGCYRVAIKVYPEYLQSYKRLEMLCIYHKNETVLNNSIESMDKRLSQNCNNTNARKLK